MLTILFDTLGNKSKRTIKSSITFYFTCVIVSMLVHRSGPQPVAQFASVMWDRQMLRLVRSGVDIPTVTFEMNLEGSWPRRDADSLKSGPFNRLIGGGARWCTYLCKAKPLAGTGHVVNALHLHYIVVCYKVQFPTDVCF